VLPRILPEVFHSLEGDRLPDGLRSVWDFLLGLLSESSDGHVEEGLDSRYTFTWEGRNDMHSVNRGLRLKGAASYTGEEEAEGMTKFHKGDRSSFQARKAP
jgi:hypothetical protein